MFAIDAPSVPPQTVTIIAKAEGKSAPSERAIGGCLPIQAITPDQPAVDGGGALGPNYTAVDYFLRTEKRQIGLPPITAVKLVKGPKHGTVTPYKHPENGIDTLRYMPATGYTGNDSVEFSVDVEGKPVRVIYYLKVTKLYVEGKEASRLCKKSEWIISGPIEGDHIAYQNATNQNVRLQFAQRSNAELASTTSAGNDFTITLSPTAAGHGWFIDPTPTTNEEFLPTSNPNEWITKESSAAYATGGYSYQQLADYFGVHFTTVGRIVRAER